MQPNNHSTQTMVIQAIDAIAPLNVRHALRRILDYLWADEMRSSVEDTKPDHIVHALDLADRWLINLERATAISDILPGGPRK